VKGCGAAGGEVVLDGQGEGGEVLVADDLSELAFGFEHPGGGPAQAHVAVLPALDVAAGGAADAASWTRDGEERFARLD